MSSGEISAEAELEWQLLYTKAHAESWVEVNLRAQGFSVLLPRVASRGGFAPLFPRYVFAGIRPGQRTAPLRSTLGVLYVVSHADRPARVPLDVIAEIRARMDAHGVVHLDKAARTDALFAHRERERVRALIKLAQAGFRVRSA